ncbi:M20/M25/M40 family metallo-hydrolase [Polyangium fumosum]|uniref:M20/M25/M40 family metallo-hydrolase n=1 Tax=Polyangium fumosum TaxID=889272 RepID=UPI0014795705|nr:M20/M25/M40 family metallo-hydrolase [Polyangium fumosum]
MHDGSDRMVLLAARLGTLVLFALAVALGFGTFSRLPPRDVTAPTAEFSAQRAYEHLKVVGAAPHPPGTPRHAEVRDYLLARLQALGAEGHVQREALFAPQQDIPRPAATVENVVGRFRGSSPGAAVLLVAHYDSVPTGPGAADDGAAVASLLEVARALRAGPDLVHDVILLFTDAEELHSLGSLAFVRSHPWAREVEVVLNVDARGNEGPVLMFETSADNGGLIRRLGQAAPHVHACSLYAEIYRRMPNDTDFSVFREAGWRGLNFANIEGSIAYHTRLETVDQMDMGTIQQQGETLLALARRPGEVATSEEGDRIYINWGPYLVHYPERWARALLAVVAMVLVVVLRSGVRRGALRPSRVAREAGALLLAVVGAGALVSLGWPLLKILQPEYRAFLKAESYGNGLYVASFGAATLAVVLAVLALRRRARPSEVAAAGCLLWTVPTVFTGLAMPGASCVFIGPLLSATVALALLCRSFDRTARPRVVLLLGLAAVPSVLLLAPVVHDLFFALQLDEAGLVAVLLALALVLFAPSWRASLGRATPVAAASAAIWALGLLGCGALAQRFDARHPRPTSLVYLLDADSGLARWVSSDAHPDAWVEAFVGDASPIASLEALPEWREPLRVSRAPSISLEAPEVVVTEDHTEGEVHTIRLRISSRRRAAFVDVQVMSARPPAAVWLAGRRVEGSTLVDDSSKQGVLLRYWAPPPEGFLLGIEEEPGGGALGVRVSDHSYELPAEVMAGPTRRPVETMPAPFREALDEGIRVTRVVDLRPAP